jgi:hypothetical protein
MRGDRLSLLLPLSLILRLWFGQTGRPLEVLRGQNIVKSRWDRHFDSDVDRGVQAKATVIICFCCLGFLGIIGFLVLKIF